MYAHIQVTPQPFVLDSQQKVEWALRKLAAIDNEEAILKAQYQSMLGDLQRRRENWKGQFEAQLEEWARTQIEGQRTKTLKTLAGNLAFRTVPEAVVVAEGQEVEAAQSAISRGLVKPVQPDLTAYRKMATDWLHDTGELLPGLTIRASYESFSIKIPTTTTEAESNVPV